MLLEESSLSQKIINKRKNKAALFFFARSFQGYKSKILRFDKDNNPFIIFRKKKIYIYSPLVINFSFKFFRALFIVFKNPKKFSLKKLGKLFYLNSFNF